MVTRRKEINYGRKYGEYWVILGVSLQENQLEANVAQKI